MKSWLRGGIIGVIISFLIFVSDIFDLLTGDLFGGLGAFGLAFGAAILITYVIISFPLGMFFGYIMGSIKSRLESSKGLLITLYYLFFFFSLIIFLYFLDKSSLVSYGFYFKLAYPVLLIFFIILNIEFLYSKIRMLVIISSAIAILIIFLSYTSIPCNSVNMFCDSNNCKSGTSFDRYAGKCFENVENCYFGFDYNGHEDCINNQNGKNLCDASSKKCVENVEKCLTNYCIDNPNGKTLCKKEGDGYGICVEP